MMRPPGRGPAPLVRGRPTVPIGVTGGAVAATFVMARGRDMRQDKDASGNCNHSAEPGRP
jgi:hypothetical protein